MADGCHELPSVVHVLYKQICFRMPPDPVRSKSAGHNYAVVVGDRKFVVTLIGFGGVAMFAGVCFTRLRRRKHNVYARFLKAQIRIPDLQLLIGIVNENDNSLVR
jgi:uncharacterized membrane protein